MKKLLQTLFFCVLIISVLQAQNDNKLSREEINSKQDFYNNNQEVLYDILKEASGQMEESGVLQKRIATATRS